MASFLLKRLQELLPSFHPLYNEIGSMVKASLNRLLAIKKHKGFADVHSINDKAITMIESDRKIDLEGIETLKSWLQANYSDDPVFRFVLTDSQIIDIPEQFNNTNNQNLITKS